jgi:PucR family transcriptional regulator, proline-responsive transcriptional activator
MDLGEWLQEELDNLAVRLGRCLSIDDLNGRVIAYSAQDATADAVRVASILSRRVAPAVRRWENQHGISEATGPVRMPANPELAMNARLCVPIRRSRSLFGYMWVLETNDAIDDAAMADASRFAARVADVLDRGAGRRLGAAGAASDLVRQLLAGPPMPEGVDELVALIPSLLGEHVRVCAIVPAAAQRESVAALTGQEFLRLNRSLPTSLQHLPRYIGSFVCPTHAVLLVQAAPTLRSGNADAVFGEVDAVANADGRPSGTVFTVGISEPVPLNAGALRDAHRQALTAAELAALDPALPTPLDWACLGAYHLLLVGQPTLDSALAPLAQAGNSADMLLRTLETYLDLGGDAQKTASHLHLHRTSLYYRLHRAAELLQADLEDGLTRLELHLALKNRRATRRVLSRGPRS